LQLPLRISNTTNYLHNNINTILIIIALNQLYGNEQSPGLCLLPAINTAALHPGTATATPRPN